jgi:hypothetical protein
MERGGAYLTERLSVEQIREKLLTLQIVRDELKAREEGGNLVYPLDIYRLCFIVCHRKRQTENYCREDTVCRMF